jgi:hypothetical protein
MEYIVNPSWFYWVKVFDSISSSSIRVAAFAGIVWIVFLLAKILEFDPPERYIKTSLVVLCIAAILYFFVPNKETMIQMQIARLATYDNASIVIESIQSAADYVVSVITELK